jgi:CDP-diacylglycerol pyrophosphatase
MEEMLMKYAMMVCLLLAGGSLMAQASPDQSSKGEQVTVQGCVSRSSGDYILMQADPGNSYVLHSANHVKLGHYLGQQVKVTGTKSPTLNDSSDAGRAATSTTIMVSSISTISKECKP